MLLPTLFCLVLSAIISVNICYGGNHSKVKDVFIALIIFVFIGVQYYYLVQVVSYVPSNKFFVYNDDLKKPQCIRSNKGGKRVFQEYHKYDINPCFCNKQVAECLQVDTDEVIEGDCPTDGTAKCRTFDNKEISLYLSSDRDCRGGQGIKCTKDEPCHPCDINDVIAFNVSRCTSCYSDNKGDCNFVPGVGPYCYEKPGSRKVIPCKKCCTDPTPVIINGRCY